MRRAPRSSNKAASSWEAPSTVLAAGEIRRLCDFLYGRTGMLFGESKRYYIERRVADRMAAARMGSFSAYFSHLQGDEAEIEDLINLFTVNET